MGLLVASRKSDLARLQAYQVGQALKEKFPQEEINYHFRQSLGDINQEDPLWKMPEKGVFTEDFRQGLLDGEFDMVVHSWKDLPVETQEGTEIVATLPRADARDLFLFKKKNLKTVMKKRVLKVFSSSPRRLYNLKPFFKEHFPKGLDQVEFDSVRGNILTRVRKLMESEDMDGLIVAKAALDRLLTIDGDEFVAGKEELKKYLSECLWQVLPISLNPTAAAQGALAVEIASHRSDLKEKLEKIHCQETWENAQNERKILKSYGGGCHQKIGVTQLSRPYGSFYYLRGLTDSGEVLNQVSFQSERSQLKASESFPLAPHAWFEREGIPYKKPKANAHFVARAFALPNNESISTDEVLWVAGLNTWKALAERGLWVHGSFESLGEHEAMGIEALAGDLNWVKWTHNQSNPSGWAKLVPTYELIPKNQQMNFKGIKNFFWMSGTSFKEAIKRYPDILKANHFCGPGNTFVFISKVLEENQISQKPQVVFGFEDWKSLMTKEPS